MTAGGGKDEMGIELKRHIAALAVLMLFATFGLAHGQEAEWHVDTATGCRLFIGVLPENSISYQGNCVDGFAEGLGVVTWFHRGAPAGIQTEARFTAGYPSLFVKMTLSGGTVMEGAMTDGAFNTNAKIRYANGNAYDGEVKNNKPDGYGVYLYKKGTRYSGQFQAGIVNGEGTVVTASGQSFAGHWLDGKPSGDGVFNDGTHVYTGRWVAGCLVNGGHPIGFLNSDACQ